MKPKEFGSWTARNASIGGLRSSGDEFNKSFKGEPYRRYKEYNSSDLEEYHHYPAMKDLTSEEEKKKRQEQSSQSQSQGRSTSYSKKQQMRSRVSRNLVTRFVAITAGAVVLVNTNPVLAERFPFLKLSIFDQAEEVTIPDQEQFCYSNWSYWSYWSYWFY